MLEHRFSIFLLLVLKWTACSANYTSAVFKYEQSLDDTVCLTGKDKLNMHIRSRLSCLSMCLGRPGCISAFFNALDMTCVATNRSPVILKSCKSNHGWRLYYQATLQRDAGCRFSGECSGEHFHCSTGICTCQPGYVFHHTTRECSCALYGPTFVEHKAMAFTGSVSVVENLSEDTCRTNCLNQFDCTGYTYYYSSRSCWSSTDVPSSQPDKYVKVAPNFASYFERVCAK